MNKRIIALILIFVISFSCVGCSSAKNTLMLLSRNEGVNLGEVITEIPGNVQETALNFKSEEEMLLSMEKGAENEKFQLFYSIDNMSVALVDKKTGRIMTTNPYNAAMDKNYSGSIASSLNSQLILTYLQNETDIMQLYSADDCAKLGQYSIKLHKNGISFDMSVGVEKDVSYIPSIISPTRYKEICSKLDEQEIETLEMYYSLCKEEDFDDSGIKDVFPDLKRQEIYFCLFEFKERDKERINPILKKAGYGKKEYESDMMSFGVEAKIISYPNFKLSLCYALTENGVSVSIPAESIHYNEDYPLLRISVLPYFGAEEPSAESKGYLFIPDGSGAIINLNKDNEAHRSIMTGTVYGINGSEIPQKTVKEVTQPYYLPVFGTVKNNETALFGLISSGDANAEITARLGGFNGNYYATNAEFVVMNYELYTKISGVSNPWSNKTFYLYDKNILRDDITVDYYILSNESANYSSFAALYNQYLFADKAAVGNSSTVHIETLGSVLAEKNFMGFDYMEEIVLTDYEQNIKILEELSVDGRGDYSLSLRGWQKYGLDASLSNKLSFSSKLGGRNKMDQLKAYCQEKNIHILLQNNLSYAKYDRIGDSFSLKNDVARTMELVYAEKQGNIAQANRASKKTYVVSVASYKKYIDSLYKDGLKCNLSENLDLGEIGKDLNTDHSKGSSINRSQSKKLVEVALANTKSREFGFEGANAYVLPYAASVSGIMYKNSGFAGESASVPFLQLVLGDKVVCRSNAINLSDSTRDLLLGCIESGTVPTYLISYDNTSKLKTTEYTAYYAVDFQILKGSIKKSYDYIKAAFEAKGGGGIVSHSILADGVTFTEYRNGKGVYVNRTKENYYADGLTIGAMDYVVKE